jgi:tartrate dehydratase beta subunit/fumarate hydratase class I family protein
VLEYPELGMEAVWKIDVVDFPAFIVVDDKATTSSSRSAPRPPNEQRSSRSVSSGGP